MKQLQVVFLLSLFLIGLLSSVATAYDYPSPAGYVNDFAGALSIEGTDYLENQLIKLEQDTTAEVVVVTTDNLGDGDLEQYAVEIFEAWGIGKKDKDNGVLFIVAFVDSQILMRIEVGYGLEGIITDGRAGRILDNNVIPYFEEGYYEDGIIAGTESIEQYIRSGSPPSFIEENPISNLVHKFSFVLPVIFVVGIITIYMMGFMARSKSIWLGGIWGIIAGLVIGFAFSTLLLIIILPIALGLFGTLLDLLLSRNYRGRMFNGQPTGWIPTFGGFRGPAVGSIFNILGKFGGFGGGRSGGGGASRKL
jgi:uncharacterized protein